MLYRTAQDGWHSQVIRSLLPFVSAFLGSGLANTPTVAQVFTSEFFSDPVSEGWVQLIYSCEPQTWNEQGWYYQQLDQGPCPPPLPGGRDVYRRSLEAFDGTTEFFEEFRVQTDGDSSEIPYGGALVLVLGNNAGLNYHITVSADLVKFAVQLDPIWFIEVDPDVPHTYRFELYPEQWVFYIDGELIDAGVPEGPFPANTPRITWQGQSWYLPCLNAWDYIRYGRTPVDGSGDYDSDGALTLFDHYFVHDCLTKDGPGIFGGLGQNAGPGCRFADFNADSDVDLCDFAEFQNLFDAAHP